VVARGLSQSDKELSRFEGRVMLSARYGPHDRAGPTGWADKSFLPAILFPPYVLPLSSLGRTMMQEVADFVGDPGRIATSLNSLN
jgi:hypothetical protein